jgi:hypothetical protein
LHGSCAAAGPAIKDTPAIKVEIAQHEMPAQPWIPRIQRDQN